MAKIGKRYFTVEFKRDAVALWKTSGRTQAEFASEVDGANIPLLGDVRRIQTRHQGRYGSPRFMPHCGRKDVVAAVAALSV